jgi:hypothetical protein
VFDQNDELMQRVADELKKPVRMDPAIDARVMQRIGDDRPDGSSVRRFWSWLLEPKLVAVSPLRTVTLAAAVIALMVVLRNGPYNESAVRSPQSAAATPDTTVIQFVLVAPKAISVSLVGDFNDWDRARTPLKSANAGGMWSVTLPLPPGRHRYAFVVDGKQWVVDPAAPRAIEDDFGSPNSVVTVGEHST